MLWPCVQLHPSHSFPYFALASICTLFQNNCLLRTHVDDAYVSYHTLEDNPSESDPAGFTLKVKHSMMFQYEEAPSKQKPGGNPQTKLQPEHAAGLLPSWTTQHTRLCWVVRWSTNANRGLQPVRPFVIFNEQGVIIPAKHAVELKVQIEPVE